MPGTAEASRFYLTGGGLSDVYRDSVTFAFIQAFPASCTRYQENQPGKPRHTHTMKNTSIIATRTLAVAVTHLS